MSPKRVKEPSAVDLPALNYEAATAELEAIVARLEAGNIPLDETVQLFERGQHLAAHCQHLLDTAELKVKTLTAPGADEDAAELKVKTLTAPGADEDADQA